MKVPKRSIICGIGGYVVFLVYVVAMLCSGRGWVSKSSDEYVVCAGSESSLMVMRNEIEEMSLTWLGSWRVIEGLNVLSMCRI